MKKALIILFFLELINSSCNTQKEVIGYYCNTQYIFDVPINILRLKKEKAFSMMYPSVIGEKELGIWEIKNDTLLLYRKYELSNYFRDTINKNDDTAYCKFIIKHKNLYSTNNKWILKKRCK